MEKQVQVMGTALEKFAWKIEAFSKVNTSKLSSNAFKIGGYRWKIVLYLKGKGVKHLSLYMKVADSLPPYGWSRFVYFRLALINQVDSKKSIVKETQQKFNAGNNGWGSPSFIHLNEFHDPSQSYLVNDTCIIEAHVSVSEVAFNILDNLVQSITTAHDQSNGDQLRLIHEEKPKDKEEEDQGILTPRPTSTHDHYKDDDQVSGTEDQQLLQHEHQGMGPSDVTLIISPKQTVQFVPSAPPMYPPLFNESEEVLLTPLTELINFKVLWEELQSFGFDLTWLEPHVQSALGAKAYLERAKHVKNLRDDVATLEIEMRKLKAKLAVAEIDLEVARRDMAEVENGFHERDMDAELGYGIP